MAEVFAANGLGAIGLRRDGSRPRSDRSGAGDRDPGLRPHLHRRRRRPSGGKVVAGPLYTPVGKTWQMDAAERAATVDRLVEGLQPLADYAGERGVTLGVEPLNRFETSLLNTAAQTMEVVDRLDSPAVGVLLDTFHMNIEEKDQAAAIRLVGDKLVHFHACGNDRGAPGGDHIAWEAIVAALARDRLQRRGGDRIVHAGQPDHRPRRGDLAPAGGDAGRSGDGGVGVPAGAVRVTGDRVIG